MERKEANADWYDNKAKNAEAHAKKELPNVVILDDENSETESDAASKGVPHFSKGRNGLSSPLRDLHSSDEDDCCVLEPGPSRRPRRRMRQRAQKEPVREPLHMRLTDSSDSSDCEIVMDDQQGYIRRHWEDAALAKLAKNAAQMGSYYVDSEESTSALKRASSSSLKLRGCGRRRPSRWAFSNRPRGRTETVLCSAFQGSNSKMSGVLLSEEDLTSSSVGGLFSAVLLSESPNEASFPDDIDLSHGLNVVTEAVHGEIHANDGQGPIVLESAVDESCGTGMAARVIDFKELIMEREKLEQTLEFKRAEEEEGAAKCQMELPKQAQQVQRLQKGIKVEAEQKLQMESRQEQRTEEIMHSHRMVPNNSSKQDSFCDMINYAPHLNLSMETIFGEIYVNHGQDPAHDDSCGKGLIAGEMPSKEFIMDREKLKQTPEFKHADEEEWTRRRTELHKQAQEAQRLRKRKKVELEQKLKMESRQKQRVEEIRLSQKVREENMDVMEQMRGTVRVELEKMASTCHDMATLLQHLGVHVDGGLTPTPQQVNAAYKRALLRFHPDRVVGCAKSNLLRQVQAEETFKLISGLKDTLKLVTIHSFT